MRVSSPSSSSRGRVSVTAHLLAALAALAASIAIVVAITGGFSIGLGSVHFSAHRWRDGLVISLAAATFLFITGRAAAAGACEALHAFIDRRATALALIVAASTMGVGVGFGTYAAAGSDAAGYVAQATGLAAASVVRDEPLARAVSWSDATWTFSPLGYRPGTGTGRIVPTYPIGLPSLMAAAIVLGGPLAAYLVVPLLGAVAVMATFTLGARLHSRQAGVVAALLLATSPVFLFQLVQPMSDVAVTAWWALAFGFAVEATPRRLHAAGAMAGIALLTRPNLIALAAVLAIFAASETRSRGRALAPLLVGATPFVVLLMLTQWRIYGSPLASGYGQLDDLFSWSAIGPNTLGDGGRWARSELPASICGLAAAGVVFSRRQASRSHRRAVILATLATSALLASYLPYGVFAEWSYLRFLLPAFPFVFVVVAALGSDAIGHLPAAVRGLTVVAVLAVVCSFNVNAASREQAFRLRDYESRYRTVGRYLAAALPENAVVVTSQQSASVSHYSGLPILRWDLLGSGLDEAVAILGSQRRTPVLLLDAWEVPQLRARFPTSAIARLDWPPRVTFVGTTRVELWDPRDDRAEAAVPPHDVLR